MNIFEFETALDVFGIKKSGITRKGRYGSDEDLYIWKGINISFGDSYYAIIDGQIPYGVAKTIYEEYPQYRDDVRIDGKYNYGEIKEEEYYKKDKKGNPYIGCYHVDSKEGLIYLLSEIQFYYENGIYIDEFRKTFYENQKAIIVELNNRLIEYGNPYKTNEEWLKNHNMVEVRNSKDVLEILPYLTRFDNTVNSFCNDYYQMKNPEECMDKFNLTLYEDKKENQLRIEICNDNNQVKYERDTNYLIHSIDYRIDSNTHMHVYHYLSQKENANVICLYKYHDNYSQYNKLDLRFDLITGLAYTAYAKEKKMITPEEKAMVIAELKKATNQATTILNNMSTFNPNNVLVKHK